MKLYSFEKFEVPVPADACGPENILNDEHRNRVVSRNDYGPNDARFREYHVIATLPHMRKAFDFDQARQLFVGNGNYARHAHTLS